MTDQTKLKKGMNGSAIGNVQTLIFENLPVELVRQSFMHVPRWICANAKKIYRKSLCNISDTHPLRIRYCPSPKCCLCCVLVPKTLTHDVLWPATHLRHVAGATTTWPNSIVAYFNQNITFFLDSFFVIHRCMHG